jgi:hypothetical protein
MLPTPGLRTLSPRYRDHLLGLENGLRGETRLHENHCSLDRSAFSRLGHHDIPVHFSSSFSTLAALCISSHRISPDYCNVFTCIIDCCIYNNHLRELHLSDVLPRMIEIRQETSRRCRLNFRPDKNSPKPPKPRPQGVKLETEGPS